MRDIIEEVIFNQRGHYGGGGGVIVGVRASEWLVSRGKKSKKLDFFWLHFVPRKVVNVVQVVCCMLSNTMPVMVGVFLDVISRSWYTIALLRRVRSTWY